MQASVVSFENFAEYLKPSCGWGLVYRTQRDCEKLNQERLACAACVLL